MADRSQKPLIQKGKVEILQPADELAMGVPIRFWRRIMTKIRDAVDSSNAYASFGFWLLGLGIGAGLSAGGLYASASFTNTQPDGSTSPNWTSIVSLSAMVTAALVGILWGFGTLRYAKQHHADKSKLLEYILEDMRDFEDRHTPTVNDPHLPAAAQ